MGKNPADQFYWEDWKRDTRCLSLAAKGAWIDLLSDMWFSQTRGRLQMPLTAYARSLGATVEQTEAVIQELMDRNICDYVKESDGSLTLINRRMSREYDQRLRWREKKRLQRTSDGVPAMSSKCLAPSSNTSKSSTSNLNPESTKTVLSSVRQKKSSGLTEPTWPPESEFVKSFLKSQTLATLSPEHQQALMNPDFWERTSIACGGIDLAFLKTEFAKIGIWFVDNPSRKPTPRGIRRFVSSWLIRAYEKERRYGVPRQEANR